ncbi:MAG: type II toxin-antitoxin system VapC family toxin [Betaproteobacteria bacterium]|nr:type II toxin-antitoxin system VapC family toxin [Betaproteobacteria bacterium]
MRLLLDTCTFLWMVDDSAQLSVVAREQITDPGNDAFLSAISAWEIAVKQAQGKLTLSEPAFSWVPKYREAHRLGELPLDEASALQAGRLPALHRDPFDRMLVCQAIAQGLAIVTPDARIAQYPVRVIW